MTKIFIIALVLIGIFDYLLILGCTKLEKEREEYDRLDKKKRCDKGIV